MLFLNNFYCWRNSSAALTQPQHPPGAYTIATSLLLVMLAVCAGMPAVQAQAYPIRPVRIIVPFAPGGGTDILTRMMAPRLADLMGQQFVVDNRPGASSQIGTDLAARSAPDGYTLLHVDTSFTSNPSLYPKLPYDSVKDFAPVALLASAPVVLIVHPSVPVKALGQLVALAKARPGALNFATGGAGSGTHLGLELLKSAAKIDLVHIPYKGSGPAAAAVLGGQVAMMFAGPSSAKPHVDAGRLRPVAITGEQRNPALPAVPTFVESGLQGVDSGTYWGALAPAGTPREIVGAVNAAMVKVLNPDPMFRFLEPEPCVPTGIPEEDPYNRG